MDQNGRNLEYRPGRHDTMVQDEIRGIHSKVIRDEVEPNNIKILRYIFVQKEHLKDYKKEKS